MPWRACHRVCTEPIGGLTAPGRAVVEGRVRVMAIRNAEDETVLPVEISDSTGDLTALFHGRDRIPGLMWRQGPAARPG